MKITELIKKHKQMILYLIFGVLTTLINIGSYWLFAHPLALSTVPATVLAWLVGVIFAFFTNKLIVFESKGQGARKFLYEMATFLLARLLTGVLDVVIMFVFVDVLHLNDLIIKIISNIVVIILNFVLSKFIVFAKGRGKEDKE